MYDYIGIIPARFSSTRFPGKPLCNIRGKSMIRRVYERAVMWEKFDMVYVATDNHKIAKECDKYSIPYIMTSDKHSDCLDRAAEVSAKLEGCDVGAKQYVIIQGDEPLFDVRTLDVDLSEPCINFYTRSLTDVYDSNVVKVVTSYSGRALYFSRYPIPYQSPETERSGVTHSIYKQIGVYVFSGEMLKTYHQLGPSTLENAEGIGLNRLLQIDIPVHMRYTEYDSISVDTPADRDKVEQILKDIKNGQ